MLTVMAVLAVAAAGALRFLRSEAPALVESPLAGATPAALQVQPAATPAWVGGSLAQAVSAPGGVGIAVTAVDGSTARSLVAGFDGVESLTWGPGGALAFAGRRGGNWDVFSVAADGTRLTRHTDHPGFDGDPAWSPAGDALAFASYRDGDAEIYVVSVGASGDGAVADPAPPRRLTEDPGPDIEPAWSATGLLAFAAFRDGAYRLDAMAPDGTGRRILAEPPEGADLRAPAWSPSGDDLAALETRHGAGRAVIVEGWGVDEVVRLQTVATSAEAIAWHPSGAALAFRGAGTDGAVMARDLGAFDKRTLQARGVVAPLASWAGPQRNDMAWSAAEPDTRLAVLEPDRDLPGSGAGRPYAGGGGAPAAPGSAALELVTFVGLDALNDVDVSGPRINAAVAADFAALREEVAAATGRDFLGRLSDMWRPLGFHSSASAYFSWHKTGRAFDTAMEFQGADGAPGLVLVREDIGGRTYWRMLLRAAAQDGSVGRPLQEPGWTFSAGGGGQGERRDGGERGSVVPDGYWLDFTAAAGSRGWRRIPSLTRSNLDWRVDWAAIEYWHYERRDGLTWFQAAREVYTDAEIAAGLSDERLEAAGVSARRLLAAGVPAGWQPES